MTEHHTAPAVRRRLSSATAALAILPLIVACDSETKRSATPTATPTSVEQFAATLGCTPQMRGKAADYRQAICNAPSGNYVINTFVNDKAQQDWLAYSSMFGGTYLIGTRWIIVSTPQQLEPLRKKIGGRIQTGGTRPTG